MSASAYVDLFFTAWPGFLPVVEALRVAGWSFEDDGEVVHLLDTDGAFAWTSETGTSHAALLDALDALDALDSGSASGHPVGILGYPEVGIGGNLLFLAREEVVSFTPTVNVRPLVDAPRFTDWGWYLPRLVPALLPVGLCRIAITNGDY